MVQYLVVNGSMYGTWCGMWYMHGVMYDNRLVRGVTYGIWHAHGAMYGTLQVHDVLCCEYWRQDADSSPQL